MKYQYEDYIKFVDEELLYLDRTNDEQGWESKIEKNYRRSLLANKATLERHKETNGGRCSECPTEYAEGMKRFPCPTYTGVTDQLDLVMGVSND